MLMKIVIAVVVLVGGFLAYASTRPDSYHVERSTKIEAPAAVVFAQIDDFKNWQGWSPWEHRDPRMQKTYEGTPRTVGSTYAWKGNKDVGSGKMTIVETSPPTLLKNRLEFVEPFESVAENAFTLKPEGPGATTVTWSMDGKNNFMGKVASVFMNMDKMIGTDFEKGLASLKTIAETQTKAAAAPAP